MITFEPIAIAQADRMLAAARSHAAAIGVAACIAILDSGAHLKQFVRMDGAVLGSSDLSIGKARTAALFATSSEAVWDYCRPDGAAHNLEASNGGLMPFPGGLPIVASDGTIIGAVGVSGGAPFQDLAIAEAAVAARLR